MTVDFELFSTRWRDDPYSKYHELRDHSPVHFAADASAYCVSRYEDVHFILFHPELFSHLLRDPWERGNTSIRF